MPDNDDYRQAAVGPLVNLLQGELAAAGIATSAPRGESLQEFTVWYLEVVQGLERFAAGRGEMQPMTRQEVELMCRCAMSGADLRQAITLCTQFCATLHPRAGLVQLDIAGGQALFRLDSLRVESSSASSLCDIIGLFAFVQLFQWLTGADLRLQRVRIGPVSRDDVLPFLRLFQAPVLAGGKDYALEFPATILDLPVIRTAAEFAEFFQTYPCFGGDMHGLPQQVAALLAAAARQGGGLPTQQEMARALGIPLSTFRRRLALAGTAFSRIRRDCLCEQAEQMLVRGAAGVAEIAAHLGFSDVAAFRRAFRQWHGDSPAAWRRRQRGP